MRVDSFIVEQKTRPIRFAFLVSVKEPKSIFEAISYSTILWGGLYNPIIPIWKRFPTKEEKSNVLNKLSSFDPDFIINLTAIDIPKEISKNFQNILLNKKDFVERNKKERKNFKLGCDVIPLINYIWSKEGIGKRRHLWRFYNKKNDKFSRLNTFLYGKFPNDFEINYLLHYKKGLKAEEIKNLPQNIYSLKGLPQIFMGSIGLRRYNLGGVVPLQLIYIADENNLKDLIRFWNLRASGREIIFLPQEQFDLFENDISNFIGRWKYSNNKEINKNIIIYKGYSVKKEMFYKTKKQINSAFKLSLKSKDNLLHWGKDSDRLNVDIVPCKLEERAAEKVAIFSDGRLNPFNVVLPSFFEKRKPRIIGKYSWAQEFKIRDYSIGNDYVFDFPNDKPFEDIVKKSFIPYGIFKSRLSDEGVVVFLNHYTETFQLQPIKVKTTFKRFFKYFGLEIELSPPGIFAERIIEFMGHLHFDCRVFKIKGVRVLLDQLGSRKKLTYKDKETSKEILKKIKNNYHDDSDIEYLKEIINTKLPKETQSLTKEQILKTLSESWKNSYWKKEYQKLTLVSGQRNLNPPQVFDYLIHKKIIMPGMNFRCNNCEKVDWYHIEEFGETFKCKYCFTEQNIPNLEKKSWEYKANGLFKIPNYAEGSIAVILTLWRFEHMSFSDNRKYITSIKIKDPQNDKKYEIDYSWIYIDRLSRTYDLILGEARNFVDFKKKEFEKLSELASKFLKKPYLCFSTLKDEFSTVEKKGLKKLDKDYPIIALTRKELDPYNLHDRFASVPRTYANELKNLSYQTSKLNLSI